MLKRKQNSKNEEWLEAWDNIEQSPAFSHIESLAENTIERIRKAMATYKAQAFAYSGGKDSIVLADLCLKAGIQKSVFVTSAELDYPVFLSWIAKHKPKGCTTIDVGIKYGFLVEHPEMLFPAPNVLPKWYALIQHKGQRDFYRDEHLDCMFMGRRKADGNMVCGSVDDCFAMHTADGRNILCPIADWKHEDVLAYLKKNRLAMPPIYSFPDGWRQGTHLWPCRLSLGDEQKNWSELYGIAPDVVEKAATYLDGARMFLEQKS